jgi:hypothetical protein
VFFALFTLVAVTLLSEATFFRVALTLEVTGARVEV